MVASMATASGVLDCIGYTLSFPVLVWENQSETITKLENAQSFLLHLDYFKGSSQPFHLYCSPQRSVSPSRRYQQLPPAGGSTTGFPLKTTVVVFVFRLRLIIIHPWWHRNQSYNVTWKCTQSHVVWKCIWVLAPFHELIKLNLSQHKKKWLNITSAFCWFRVHIMFCAFGKTYLHPQAPDLTTGITIKAPETSFELGLERRNRRESCDFWLVRSVAARGSPWHLI